MCQTVPLTSRRRVVRRVMASTVPVVSPASMMSPTPNWSSTSMKMPARKSLTRLWAPKPIATPAMPAPAMRGPRFTPSSARIDRGARLRRPRSRSWASGSVSVPVSRLMPRRTSRLATNATMTISRIVAGVASSLSAASAPASLLWVQSRTRRQMNDGSSVPHASAIGSCAGTTGSNANEPGLSVTHSILLGWGMRGSAVALFAALNYLFEEGLMADLDTMTLPVLPLTDDVVLPGMVVTLALETDEAKAAADAASKAGDTLLLVPRHPDGRYARVGTIARIENRGNLPGGMPALVIRATLRAELGLGVIGETSGLWVHASPVDDGDITDAVEAQATELRAALRALFEALGGRRLAEVLRGVDGPTALADLVGWWPDLSTERKDELLETIRNDVTEGLEGRQREFLLRQQMDAIRKELGEDDDDSVGSYRERLGALIEAGAVTEATRKAVEREIDRFERTPEQNVEHGWIRNWLDTVFEIPWGERSVDDYDIARARAVLDADHTGLEEVKERIVEMLAVRKLLAERAAEARAAAGSAETPGVETTRDETTDGDTTDPGAETDATDGGGTTVPLIAEIEPVTDNGRRPGAIVALAGPPGVGKTSLGASVARALGRKFTRVALGGIRDEAEIRGHRRTYVGAQAGRIVRALQEAGTMNPVILLDEVDKIGADWRGDPSSALLEVLDPAQNHTFRDHYLEVDLDLSDVLFLATANMLENIPGPLLDRMEVIRLDGYTHDEKVAIARDHLFDRQRARNGLRDGEVEVTDEAFGEIVEGYTREAGVRNLEREIGKGLRKG